MRVLECQASSKAHVMVVLVQEAISNLCIGIDSYGCQHCCLFILRLLGHLPLELEDTEARISTWLGEDFNWDDPLHAQMPFPEADKTFGDLVILPQNYPSPILPKD